jgi:hypothetical protein
MSFLNNIIQKREKHWKNYLEFNNQEEYNYKLEDIVNWVIIIARDKENKGEKVKILELGTKRSKPDTPTNRKHFFQNIKNVEYVMTDYQKGIDVDVVCDLHKINDIFKDEEFDLILSFSTYEHLKYPQLVSHNLMKMLKVGGIILISTHQSFPLHGYKFDYFRFSREAIKSIFSKKMNFITITSYFTDSCIIIPHNNINQWNHLAESYLNVFYIGEKINKTPHEYIYDIDDNDN